MKLPSYLVCSMAFLWAWSGLQPVLSAFTQSIDLLAQAGIPEPFRLPIFYAASGLDLLLALACFTRLQKQPWFWLAQFGLVSACSLIIAFRLPEMWLHPFAPLIKNIPILAVLFFLYRYCGERS